MYSGYIDPFIRKNRRKIRRGRWCCRSVVAETKHPQASYEKAGDKETD
jgi:hypothetical protein